MMYCIQSRNLGSANRDWNQLACTLPLLPLCELDFFPHIVDLTAKILSPRIELLNPVP